MYFPGFGALQVVVLSASVALAATNAGGQTHGPVSIPAEIGPPDEGLRLAFTPATFAAGSFAVHRSAEAIARLAARLRALDLPGTRGRSRIERAQPGGEPGDRLGAAMHGE